MPLFSAYVWAAEPASPLMVSFVRSQFLKISSSTKLVQLDGIVTDSRLIQPSKVLPPRDSSPSGRTTVLSEIQLLKAFSPSVFKPLEKVTVSSKGQLSKQLSTISVTPEGILMLSIPELKNALSESSVRFLLSLTSLRFGVLWKAATLIKVTVEGTVTFVTVVLFAKALFSISTTVFPLMVLGMFTTVLVPIYALTATVSSLTATVVKFPSGS